MNPFGRAIWKRKGRHSGILHKASQEQAKVFQKLSIFPSSCSSMPCLPGLTGARRGRSKSRDKRRRLLPSVSVSPRCCHHTPGAGALLFLQLPWGGTCHLQRERSRVLFKPPERPLHLWGSSISKYTPPGIPDPRGMRVLDACRACRSQNFLQGLS